MSFGGAEKNIETLLKHFPAESDLFLVLLNPTIQYEIPSFVKVVHLHNALSRRNMLWFMVFLPLLVYRYLKICQRHKIKTSYSLLNRANLLNALCKRFNDSIRFIVSEHCPYDDILAQSTPVVRWFKIKTLRFINSNAYRTQVVSKGIAQELRETYGCTNQMELIYNPIDDNLIRKLAQTPENFTFDPLLRYWIHVGNFHVYKNHALLIHAFHQIRQANDRLLLIGSGVTLDETQQLVNQLKLNDQVIFLGQQRNPYYYMARSYCLLLTSELEGLSNVILEALCLGKPVISTDCPYGPREIMAPGSKPQAITEIEKTAVGFLVPNKNPEKFSQAMIRLIQEDEIVSYQHNALLRANDFVISKIVRQFNSLLSD